MTKFLEQLSPAIKVSNNAVGGTTSETAARCFGALVDAEADLVFLEFGINDRCADGHSSVGAALMCWPQVSSMTLCLGAPLVAGVDVIFCECGIKNRRFCLPAVP